VRLHPGLRIAGAWDPFECALWAALAGRAGGAGACALLGDLARRLGRPAAGGPDGLTRIFPAPAALASATLAEIGLGPPSAAVRRLARAAVAGAFGPGEPAGDPGAALAALPDLRPGAAALVELLALGEPDAFPSADLALRRAAGGGSPLTAAELGARAEAWRPWRGYAAAHLWRAGGAPRRGRSASPGPARPSPGVHPRGRGP
jgi:AraC family transcriptional regulator of adaptative response / DNA-3-methyladenine glycosylase II